MSDQDGKRAPAMPRPSTEDTEAWKVYWEAQGQPWRTEPEIDRKRQEELAQRRTIVPGIKKGIYQDFRPLLLLLSKNGTAGSSPCTKKGSPSQLTSAR